MKKTLKLLGIVAIAAIIVFSFVACKNNDSEDTPISSFAGTWDTNNGCSIVFSGSNFTYKVNGTTKYSGTFTVSGSTITFNESSLGTASGNFSLSGNTLTLSNHTWDSSVNGTYTKDSGNTGGGDTPISSFAGTWNASGNRSIVFSGSSFTYKVNGITKYSGTFTVSGSTITFNATGLGTASGNFSLSGNTLTLSNHTWDSSVNGTYTKE
jgi:polyisoprenoid-binding protein YceI